MPPRQPIVPRRKPEQLANLAARAPDQLHDVSQGCVAPARSLISIGLDGFQPFILSSTHRGKLPLEIVSFPGHAIAFNADAGDLCGGLLLLLGRDIAFPLKPPGFQAMSLFCF